MYFTLDVPSLQNISLSKCAFSLWKVNYINESSFLQFTFDELNLYDYSYGSYKEWDKMKWEICDRVQDLVIPKIFKPELIKFVDLLESELRAWLNHLIHTNCITNYTLFNDQKLCKCVKLTQWTSHGRVDAKRTAEMLSRMAELTIKERIDIVGRFCLADAAMDVWHQLSNSEKEIYISRFTSRRSTRNYYYHDFWKYQLGIHVDTISKPNTFYNALYHVNWSAVEYFWSLMNEHERTSCVATFTAVHLSKRNKLIVRRLLFSDNGILILCFLIAQMKDEELFGSLFIFRYLIVIWNKLLENSFYVKFFMPLATRVLYLLDANQFYTLFVCLSWVQNNVCGHANEIREYFEQLWTMASTEMKASFLAHESDVLGVCHFLCNTENLSNLELILSDISNVVGRRKVLWDCFIYTVTNKKLVNWDLFQNVVEKLLTTTKEMNIFKQLCSDNSDVVSELFNCRPKSVRFSTFLKM